MKSDLYQRITNRIFADLEQGVRSWLRPWNAGHTADRISRPLRWNGKPYFGIDVFNLWARAFARAIAPPFDDLQEALELGRHLRSCVSATLSDGRDELSTFDHKCTD